MRTIKFRGKAHRVNGDVWIYGDLRHHKGDVCIFKQEGNGGEQVKPDTVGQFTEILDKNGKEIYEGDIVTLELSDKSVIYKLVKYIPEMGSFCIAETTELQYEGKWTIWHRFDQRYIHDYEGTVVGNIYDNPELLEK